VELLRFYRVPASLKEGFHLSINALYSSAVTLDINERAQHLLKTLIESYIREGQPVGSRKLARESRLQLSPATIRNIMSDLEMLGLVTSPHTSAGRVPTPKGYRMFIDTLLKVEPLDSDQLRQMKEELQRKESIQDMASCVSGLLSDISSMAGVVMLPRRAHRALRHIEFMPLSERRVLVIMVINEQEVENTIIHMERTYTSSELQQIANCLNKLFVGMDLAQVRERLLMELNDTRERMDAVMREAISVAGQVLEKDKDDDNLVFAGQTNLLEFDELANVETLRDLFEAFNEKRQVLRLLDQCLNTEGVQIFIGEESGYDILDECSIVTSTYQVEGRVLGVLGIIGPTRMAYERVIPLVDVTAKMVSAALSHSHASS